jgi:periplasmic divalent cation tolerance protein
MRIIEIYTNCPSLKVAQDISMDCIEKKYVACSNILQNVISSFSWDGNIEHATECKLIMKTRLELFKPVESVVKKLHPYETPCIVGTEIQHINDDYKQWIYAATMR